MLGSNNLAALYHVPESRREEWLAEQVRSIQGLPSQFADLLICSLASVPDKRPSVAEWRSCLEESAASLELPISFGHAEMPSAKRRTEIASSLLTVGADDDAVNILQPVLANIDQLDSLTAFLALYYVATADARHNRWANVDEHLRVARSVLDADEVLPTETRRKLLGFWGGLASTLAEQRGDIKECVRLVIEATELVPEDPGVWEAAAATIVELEGDYEKAIPFLEQAMTMSVRLNLYQDLIVMCIDSGKADAALQHAIRATEHHPTSGWAHALRIIVHSRFGFRGRADVDDCEFGAQYVFGDPLTPPPLREMVADFIRRSGGRVPE